MENREQTPVRPAWRVGTFTFGVTLVGFGLWMLLSLLLPELDLLWALKLSPLMLVLLGAEVLLAARKNSAIQYDWVGMLLCFVFTIAALCLYSVAWWFTYYGPEIGEIPNGGYYDGAVSGDESSLYLDYASFHGRQFRLLELEGGDVLQLELENDRGSVQVQLLQAADGETIFDEASLADGTYTIDIPETGAYELWVTGSQAAGSFSLERAESR